jgi:hypothetical protein
MLRGPMPCAPVVADLAERPAELAGSSSKTIVQRQNFRCANETCERAGAAEWVPLIAHLIVG